MARTALRIGVVAPPMLPIPPVRYAGTERVVATLVMGLAARGHQVTLFASGDSTWPGEIVPTVPVGVWVGGHQDETPFVARTAAIAARHAHRFDILHSHLGGCGLTLARAVHSVPVVTTLHLRLDLPGTYEAVRDLGDAPLVAVSDSQRRWHPDANWVATIHNGLPLAGMPFAAASGDYLALVGRVTPLKGIAEAIEVARSTGLPLRVAAKVEDEGERAHFEEVLRPALGEGVEFLGELGPADRDPLLAGARATLMLGAWPEPFGLVAIESMATGTPVIARRAGALPEIVEHGVDGYIVDDMLEAALAVRLAPGLDRARIRERALARFGADRMVDAYDAVLRRVAGGST